MIIKMQERNMIPNRMDISSGACKNCNNCENYYEGCKDPFLEIIRCTYCLFPLCPTCLYFQGYGILKYDHHRIYYDDYRNLNLCEGCFNDYNFGMYYIIAIRKIGYCQNGHHTFVHSHHETCISDNSEDIKDFIEDIKNDGNIKDCNYGCNEKTKKMVKEIVIEKLGNVPMELIDTIVKHSV